MNSEELIPAARYLRMSKYEQQNSFPIQDAVIQRFAEKRGFKIVKSYEDPGKSGLEIKHRPGLSQLLQDVIGGHAPFKAILVYDVSRWGRFQDIDESAHYEFLCRSAGIQIHYCAEQFINDGTMPSDLMKALKRTMAAEYIRQLSVKVRDGMRILVSRGFRGGGIAGYGLRRMMISPDGRKRQVLETGEKKCIQSHHVILVPGPRREAEVIRLIFERAAKRRMTPKQIADELTRRKITYSDGAPWNKLRVYQVLKNEKYTGASVWGKVKKPYGKPTEKQPRKAWTRKDDAFVPLVRRKEFERVQKLLRLRNRKIKKPASYYLNAMRRVLKREGKLTYKLLKASKSFNPRAYMTRFGSTMRAYQLIGYKPSPNAFSANAGFRRMQELKKQLLSELGQRFPTQLRMIRFPSPHGRKCIQLANGVLVVVYVCRPLSPTLQGPRWMLNCRFREQDKNQLSLICLPDKASNKIVGFYLVPAVKGLVFHFKVLRDGHPLLTGARRMESLSQFYEVALEISAETSRFDITTVGDTEFRKRASLLLINGTEIRLSRIEALLAEVLVQNAGQVVRNSTLCQWARNPNEWFTRAHISALRKKLGKFRKRIVTVPNEGYSYRLKD